MIRVEVICAWPRRFEATIIDLPEGSTVADGLAASGLAQAGITGFAVFGERVDSGHLLRDGDRLELLRPLEADPKEARRRRALKRPSK
ncbi:MAG: RnfH family protein [Luteimonas sp.]